MQVTAQPTKNGLVPKGCRLLSPTTASAVADGLVAGTAAWALSGLPSTVVTLVRASDPLASVRAAGTLVLAPDRGETALLVAGVAAHTALSLGWATLFSLALPSRRTVPAGLAAGLAVAALDLGAVGRHYPAIRALPPLPQVSDHLAFGALVGLVVQQRRRHRLA
ncbi:MAG: hypothetical protein M3507_04990 [Actinomycetota bacterium]|nr:hypothetical protein [Actinomycetota bacterium]